MIHCKKCNSPMEPGIALANTTTTMPDFINDDACVTYSVGGPGKLIECLKCPACGWSVKTNFDTHWYSISSCGSVRLNERLGLCAKEEWRGKCCCTCKYRLEDFYHCTTAAHAEPGKCVCSEHKGWVCAPEETDRVYSGWTEHGLCEMHCFKEA